MVNRRRADAPYPSYFLPGGISNGNKKLISSCGVLAEQEYRKLNTSSYQLM
jgi:hypothetical protein